MYRNDRKPNAVRKVYKELIVQDQTQEDVENYVAFKFNSSFESPENKAMARKVLGEVQSVYGKEKWKKAVIKDAVHQHWKSLRDDFTRKSSNKYEEHRRNVKRNNRMKRKLSRRLSSLEKTPLSEKDKERAQEILLAPNAIEYMSSEESDSGATENDRSRGPKPRKIRKLGWERTKLRNLKARIDDSHNESLSDKQRRTSAHVTRTGDLSSRPSPVNGPRWAVRLSDN